MRMALLWSQLPTSSRTARRQEPAAAWGDGDWLLWHIEYQLRSLAWWMSDKKKRGPEPKPLKTPAQLAESRSRAEHALRDKDEITRILGLETDG